MNLSDLKSMGLDLEFPFKSRYDNYIGGRWVPPVEGEYFDNVSPVTGQVFCQVARSGAADIDLALDAAHRPRNLLAGRVSGRYRQHQRPHHGGAQCPLMS